MTTRRKWRVVTDKAVEFPSETSAYDHVDALRDDWLDGASIGKATVQVDDGLGFGWQPYEHIDFAEEAV